MSLQSLDHYANADFILHNIYKKCYNFAINFARLKLLCIVSSIVD